MYSIANSEPELVLRLIRVRQSFPDIRPGFRPFLARLGRHPVEVEPNPTGRRTSSMRAFILISVTFRRWKMMVEASAAGTD